MNILTEQIPSHLEVLAEAAGAEGRFRFRGTALVQGGLSRNGRYYPPEVVARLVESSRDARITLYARHRLALEGSALPVGRVDRLYLEGSALKYEATLVPTSQGLDLQKLIQEGVIGGVSIRAAPYTSRRVRRGEQVIEQIETLTLRGIDFTDDPGVPEAAGFEILEETALWPLEEEPMNLQSLDLETLRAQRPDLVQALGGESAGVLEEIRQTLAVADAAALPAAVRELARLRARQEITALVDTELAGDLFRQAIKERLLEECATVAEARERLEKERRYTLSLRQAITPSGLFPGGGPAGRGLVENPEEAGLTPERAHVRCLAGL